MFALSPLFALLALALCAAASPHTPGALVHRHHALARAAVPEVARRSRSNGARCKAQTASSAALPSATPSLIQKPEPTSTTEAETEAETTSTEAPTSTSAEAPAPPTTTEAAPTPSQPNDGAPAFMIGTQTGEGTYYGTGLGACGITNTDTDYIAAVSHLLFDYFPGYKGGNPNNNPICNRKVKATYKGKSVTVAITDRCTACAVTDLDFSPSAFDQIADEALGRLFGMTWEWL